MVVHREKMWHIIPIGLSGYFLYKFCEISVHHFIRTEATETQERFHIVIEAPRDLQTRQHDWI